MEHCRLDLHRFDLRQRLEGRSVVTVEEFEKKTGDISSISGSDSDSEDDEVGPEETDSALDTDQSTQQLSTKDNEHDLVSSLRKISNNTIWVVLMTGGGHFAGAVFKGKEILQHKTFHQYTVRAKQGTAQGPRDSQNHSHRPKSAGAALRRYNETALLKDIHNLLESWVEYLKEASAIFLRAPSYNKTIFWRLWSTTGQKRSEKKDTEISSIFSPSKRVWKKKPPKPVCHPVSSTNVPAEGEEVKEESSGEEYPGTIEIVEMTLGTLEYEVLPNKRKRRKWKEKREDSSNREITEEKSNYEKLEEGKLKCEDDSKEMQKKSKSRRKPKGTKHQPEEEELDKSWEYSLMDTFYTACKTGDIQSLHTLLLLPEDQGEEKGKGERNAKENPTSRVSCLLNKPIDSAGFTLLHVASAAGQSSVIRLLMDEGSDPANKDKKGQTPYGAAPEEDTRNTFRKYMAEHPHKYDYTETQLYTFCFNVPGPLTEEIESKKAEKKKAQKAARKQRERDQKEEKLKKHQEEEEQRRFITLSNREKRALAAERRLAEHMATTGVTLNTIRQCFQFGESLLGKIPFEYLDYSFCTPRCVQAHRKANAAARP